MKFAGIIFDFNGVLLWDNELHEQTWRDMATQLRGYPLTDAEIVHHVHGWPNAQILAYLLGRPCLPDEVERLGQAKETAYRALCGQLGAAYALSPGAIPLLDFLVAHDIPRTIATASEGTNVNFFIQTFDLARWFDVNRIVYDDGHLPGKPAPDIYLRAAALLGLTPATCVVVEDSVAGMRAAQRAGIGRIYALGPASQHARLSQIEGVQAVISDLTMLPTEIFHRSA